MCDPFGQRIEKTIKKGDTHKIKIKTQQYLYDNEDILAIYDNKGRILSSFIHGPGLDEPLAIAQKKDIYYYVFGGLGSVVGLTNKKGKEQNI